jgi:outer membrane protein assembly factor BamB
LEPPPCPTALFRPHSLPETDPESFNYSYAVRVDGETVEEYLCPDEMWFGLPETYTGVSGVTTFRGNNFRDNSSWGSVNITEETLTELYRFNIGALQRTDGGFWSGVGWTGQPAIIQWEPEIQAQMNLRPEKKAKAGLVEVIQGAMDGKIYFFDLDDGEFTRDPLLFGDVIKGSVTLDPRGYPLLYIGQGDNVAISRFGYFIFSLIDFSELCFINGRDPFAPRSWGAFDANPLFDIPNDRMLLCGENGIIYNVKLNTNFDRAAGTISIDPHIARYRYTFGGRVLGMEASPNAFGHYLFTADNSGLVQCIDLHTFTPVWMRDCTDDTNASTVLEWEEENQRLVLYTICEVDRQGHGGRSYLRKLDASNGELLWEYSHPALHDTAVGGGANATPAVGRGDISGLVIFWAAKMRGNGPGGALIAFDKQSGETVWEITMPHFGWSSPAILYNQDGTSYIIASDSAGFMYLIRGTTGEILDRINLGGNIEASPAVFGNRLVVGTRGQRVIGVEIN